MGEILILKAETQKSKEIIMTERTQQIRDLVMELSIMSVSKWEEIDNALSKDDETGKPRELPYGEKAKRVTELLKAAGIPVHLKGYKYIREAILLVIDHTDDNISSITKEIYPKIVQKFNVTPQQVDRAIRNAIDVAWDRGDPEIHNKIFGYTISSESGKPKNSEAILGFADYVKLYMLV